jgi:hypothetical protein
VTTDHIHTCGWPVALDHADAPACPWAAAHRPPGGGPAFDLYDASKWALNGLTGAWATALRPHGIRVNSFGMGATDTPMYRGFLGGRPPAPGVMDPADVAAVLLDLLAEGPEGRTGDSIQLWIGHPCVLSPPTGGGRQPATSYAERDRDSHTECVGGLEKPGDAEGRDGPAADSGSKY